MLSKSICHDIRYGVLGPLRLPGGMDTAALRGPKLRKLFALLLVRANRPVGMDTLVDELWDGEPPRTWLATVRTHVYHLRRLLDRQAFGLGADLLATEPAGYVLRVSDDEVDAQVFLKRVGAGRALLADGAVAEAAEVLRDGLALWRGRPLTEVCPGRPLQQHIAHLEEARIGALELRICADLRLGRHRDLVAELASLVTTYPLHEWFHARYMEVLDRSGRRAEALRAYQALRAVLTEELGVDPGPEVRGLHQRILAVS
jgi:DNA-binding SARP family transcriptional activator